MTSRSPGRCDYITSCYPGLRQLLHSNRFNIASHAYQYYNKEKFVTKPRDLPLSSAESGCAERPLDLDLVHGIDGQETEGATDAEAPDRVPGPRVRVRAIRNRCNLFILHTRHTC